MTWFLSCGVFVRVYSVENLHNDYCEIQPSYEVSSVTTISAGVNTMKYVFGSKEDGTRRSKY